MNENKKDRNMSSGSLVPSRHVLVQNRPSLFRTLEEVKVQVEYELFGKEINGRWIEPDGIYREVCLLMAEMYIKPPEAIVRIRGSEMEAGVVQEVYRALEHEHVEHVIDRFREQTGLIRKKTPYLQTALYNVLFEIDAHYTNLVNHDLYGG